MQGGDRSGQSAPTYMGPLLQVCVSCFLSLLRTGPPSPRMTHLDHPYRDSVPNKAAFPGSPGRRRVVRIW